LYTKIDGCGNIPRCETSPPKLFLHYNTPMSLYYEAAAILSNSDKVGGSLKSRIFGKRDLKSSPANVFALVTETTKWSPILKEVVEKSSLLKEERKVTRNCLLVPTVVTDLLH
jgi:hypothetical protein